MSHAAMDSDVLFWLVVVLTLLLLLFIGAVVRTHPTAADAPEPPKLNLPRPYPPASPRHVRWQPARVTADAEAWSTCTGNRPRHPGALNPGLMMARRAQESDCPPWGPAPRPPGAACSHAVPWPALLGQVPAEASVDKALQPEPVPLPYAEGTFYPARMICQDPGPVRPAPPAQGRAFSGGRAGAHRRTSRHGVHRSSTSSGRTRGAAGQAGRHRAGQIA